MKSLALFACLTLGFQSNAQAQVDDPKNGTIIYEDTLVYTGVATSNTANIELPLATPEQLALSKLKLFDLSKGKLEQVDVTIEWDYHFVNSVTRADGDGLIVLTSMFADIELNMCDSLVELNTTDFTTSTGSNGPLVIDGSGSKTFIHKFEEPVIWEFIDRTVKNGPDILTQSCPLRATQSIFTLGPFSGAFTQRLEANITYRIKVEYKYGPKEMNFGIRGFRIAQPVFIEIDDGQRLAAGKETMVAARLRLGQFEDPRMVSDVELDKELEIKLRNGSEEPVLRTDTDDTDPPTVRNIIQATRGAGDDPNSDDGLLIRFFFTPTVGVNQLEIFGKIPPEFNVKDIVPSNDTIQKSAMAIDTHRLDLDFVAIRGCDLNPGCYGHEFNEAAIGLMRTIDTDFIQKIFPLADGAVRSQMSQPEGVLGSSSTAKYGRNEIFSVGLIRDLLSIKKNLAKQSSPVEGVAVVPQGYLERNYFGSLAAEAVGLWIRSDWPIIVQDTEGAMGTVAHELAHTLGRPHNEKLTGENSYDISARRLLKNATLTNFIAEKSTGMIADIWVERVDYQAMLSALALPRGPDPKVAIVAGYLVNGASVEVESIEISETGTATLDDVDGDLGFKLLGAGGSIISVIHTSPPTMISIEARAVDGNGKSTFQTLPVDISDRRPFVVSIPLPDEPVSVSIERNGSTLTTLSLLDAQFDSLIRAIRALPASSFVHNFKRTRESLIRLAALAGVKYRNGDRRASYVLLDRSFRKRVMHSIVTQEQVRIFSILDGLLADLALGLETREVRALVQNLPDSAFLLDPSDARPRILGQISTLQNAINRRHNHKFVYREKSQLLALVRQTVATDYQESLTNEINKIFLKVSCGNEAKSLSEHLSSDGTGHSSKRFSSGDRDR
ncbi:MAG: hypothetical protein AB7F86_06705 [Bdellovibrionales bacterium]